MCLICNDFAKSKLTIKEAQRNLNEMKEQIDEQHFKEVSGMLQEAQIEKFWKDMFEGVDDEEYWEKVGFGD